MFIVGDMSYSGFRYFCEPFEEKPQRETLLEAMVELDACPAQIVIKHHPESNYELLRESDSWQRPALLISMHRSWFNL